MNRARHDKSEGGVIRSRAGVRVNPIDARNGCDHPLVPTGGIALPECGGKAVQQNHRESYGNRWLFEVGTQGGTPIEGLLHRQYRLRVYSTRRIGPGEATVKTVWTQGTWRRQWRTQM